MIGVRTGTLGPLMLVEEQRAPSLVAIAPTSSLNRRRRRIARAFKLCGACVWSGPPGLVGEVVRHVPATLVQSFDKALRSLRRRFVEEFENRDMNQAVAKQVAATRVVEALAPQQVVQDVVMLVPRVTIQEVIQGSQLRDMGQKAVKQGAATGVVETIDPQHVIQTIASQCRQLLLMPLKSATSAISL